MNMGFLYSQLFVRLPYPEGTYAGKTIIVTGSNVGLGKEAARHFARLGAARVILAVRSLDKGQAAKEDIEATTGCGGMDVVSVWQLDMSSYASVQQFAARVAKELDRVDIFIANAGVARVQFHEAESEEETITVNVISTALLMALVMPKLKETAKKFNTRPTFTVTSSEVHAWTQFPERKAAEGEIFSTLSDRQVAEKNLAANQQYPISKLLEVLYVRDFAERYPAQQYPVTVNCVNPGLCHSELGRDMDSWTFWLLKKVLARTTEAGSRTLVHAGSQGAESHGQYMSDCGVAAPGPFVTSKEGKEAQGRVADELNRKLEKIQSGVTRNFSS